MEDDSSPAYDGDDDDNSSDDETLPPSVQSDGDDDDSDGEDEGFDDEDCQPHGHDDVDEFSGGDQDFQPHGHDDTGEFSGGDQDFQTHGNDDADEFAGGDQDFQPRGHDNDNDFAGGDQEIQVDGRFLGHVPRQERTTRVEVTIATRSPSHSDYQPSTTPSTSTWESENKSSSGNEAPSTDESSLPSQPSTSDPDYEDSDTPPSESDDAQNPLNPNPNPHPNPTSNPNPNPQPNTSSTNPLFSSSWSHQSADSILPFAFCSAHADSSVAVRRLKNSAGYGVRDACRDAAGSLAGAVYLRRESNAAAAGLFGEAVCVAVAVECAADPSVAAGLFGEAVCVAVAVECAADPSVAAFQKLCLRICKLVNRAKAALLPVFAQVGLVDNLFQSTHNCLRNSDWATRKAAAETLIALASHSRNFIAENTTSTLTVLEACRFAKITLIGDCMIEALQLWKNVAGKGDGASNDQKSLSGGMNTVFT